MYLYLRTESISYSLHAIVTRFIIMLVILLADDYNEGRKCRHQRYRFASSPSLVPLFSDDRRKTGFSNDDDDDDGLT